MKDSAPEGLIHALVLNGKGGADVIDCENLNELPSLVPGLWLHLNYEQEESAAWLNESSGLNDIAVSALVSEETRPRCVVRGERLLLSLRGINLSPGNDPEDMVSLRIWTDGQKLISTRRRQLFSTQDVLDELEEGQGPKTIPELLVAWIDRIVWRMNQTVENLDDQMLELEERILNNESRDVRLQLSRLRRQSISIRRYLAPQREAMNRLVSDGIPWMDELNRLRLREINDRLVRYIEEIDEIKDRASLAQEELVSRISEQLNQRSYVFTVVATIFLPLGFFTGLMGINVGGMPGVEDDLAFWVVVGLCVLISLGLAVLFRWKRWL